MLKIIVEHFDYCLAFLLVILWIIGEIGAINYIRECKREETMNNGKEKVLRHKKSAGNKGPVHDTTRAKSKRKKLPVQKNRT